MRRRIVILSIILGLLFIMLPLSLFFGNTYKLRITLAVQLIIITFVIIYIFSGTGKLVSSIIYAMFIGLLLYLIPKYDTALIFIGTFIFALNPLVNLENVVDERFSEEKSILSQLRGSHAPYYEYRKEIKNYYHLPQMRKVFNKPNYLRLRQALTIVLSMIAVFLLIREVNNLINLLKNFTIHSFFASTYIVIVLVVVTIILYRKGFQSMLNFLTISIFPPLAYYLFLAINPPFMAYILGSLTIIIGVAAGIYQYIAFRGRIVFEYYYYYDNDLQAEVYANALYEPFVYNDSYNLVVKYQLDINKNKFDKIFHNLVVYADIFRFFITTYTNDHNKINIYCEFHYGSEKRISKFAKYMESLINEKITYQLTVDHDKDFYETNFFHKTDYIVARTNYLAEILKKLNIEGNVIISFTTYFSSIEEIEEMSKTYAITRLYDLDLNGIYTIRIDLKVTNNEHVIESKVRELLLDLLINRGKYVRVNVYY